MKICVVGYGAMGKLVSSMAKEELACVVAKESPYQTLEAAPCPFDIIVDFSHPDNLEMIRTYALKHSIPVLFATTGYTDRQLEQIEELSKSVPVLRSANFSLGVILLNRLLKQIVPLLKDDFDIEVTEAHHHYKVDAPSGTAKMFLKPSSMKRALKNATTDWGMLRENRTKSVYTRFGADPLSAIMKFYFAGKMK